MIVYRMLDDGGFVAGDTDTGRTSYVNRTSLYAIRAKLSPDTALLMATQMVDGLLPLEGRFQEFGAPYDAANWVLLNERGGSRFP